MSDSCLAVETPLLLVSLLGSVFSILFSLRPSGPWGVSKPMSSNPPPSFIVFRAFSVERDVSISKCFIATSNNSTCPK